MMRDLAAGAYKFCEIDIANCFLEDKLDWSPDAD